ncbi:hypothetical protein NPIL_149591 [Nephila pilipes]|uniref:Uncharacterized protein n=1 Tax=Nephila pilipes TaxID=299642 RepID=A0A8X6NBE2_NEPPI|nr:hypothetical protein NPIL_149591 [Nephila pilipes]
MTGGFKLITSGPTAIETKLGWTLFGKNGTDCESRRAQIKVRNGEVIKAVQNLYPLELSTAEEPSSKFSGRRR